MSIIASKGIQADTAKVEEAPKNDIQYARRNGIWIQDGFGLALSIDYTLTGLEPVSVGTLIGSDTRTWTLADPEFLDVNYEIGFRNQTEKNNRNLIIEPPASVTINGLADPVIILRGELFIVARDSTTNYIMQAPDQQRILSAATQSPDTFSQQDVVNVFRNGFATPFPQTLEQLYDKQVIESVGLSQTTEDIDDIANRLTVFDVTIPLSGGVYKFDLSCTPFIDATNRAVAVEFHIDDVLIDNERISRESKDSRDRVPVTKCYRKLLAGGDHNFKMYLGKDYGGGAAVASVQNTRVFMELFI